MARAERPLSPHLMHYKWYFTMALSIFHRASGVSNVIGLAFITWWFLALASGPESFATAQGVIGSWFGVLVMIGFTLALFYHMGNGIRHLLWDMGYALDLKPAYQTGYAVLAFAVAMTVAVWLTYALV